MPSHDVEQIELVFHNTHTCGMHGNYLYVRTQEHFVYE